MPLNLLKTYNHLLEVASMNEFQRKKSLKGVFERDITDNLSFRTKKINPTPADGQESMERLFTHLTTVITDKKTNKREFDTPRSVRLHMYLFSVAEPKGIRTYIYDRSERYVIVLEPMRRKNEYYLLTAYHIEGKDAARKKIAQKYKRRLPDVR